LLLRCLITLQESLKSLAITATEYKTDARVDGTVRDGHEVGDRQMQPNAHGLSRADKRSR